MIATNNFAVGQLWAGRLDEAASNLLAMQARCRELGIGLTELSVHGHLALIDVIHGQVPAAAQRTEAAMDLADRRGWTAEPQALGLHVALAMVNLERGRFAVTGDVSDDEPADGTGTDVACRLALAIVAVDQASARAMGSSADEAAIRLERIQVQGPGACHRCWRGGASPRELPRIWPRDGGPTRSTGSARSRWGLPTRTRSVGLCWPRPACASTNPSSRLMHFARSCTRLRTSAGPQSRPEFSPESRRTGCTGTRPH